MYTLLNQQTRLVTITVLLLLLVAVSGCQSSSDRDAVAATFELTTDEAAHTETLKTPDGATVKFSCSEAGVLYWIERKARDGSSTLTYFRENGLAVKRVDFRDGRPHGEYRYWYYSGVLRERGQFTDGQPTGKWKIYRNDGSLDGEGTMGEPVPVATSFLPHWGLPLTEFYEKGDDWIVVDK